MLLVCGWHSLSAVFRNKCVTAFDFKPYQNYNVLFEGVDYLWLLRSNYNFDD